MSVDTHAGRARETMALNAARLVDRERAFPKLLHVLELQERGARIWPIMDARAEGAGQCIRHNQAPALELQGR
jgi:hypothetical protein